METLEYIDAYFSKTLNEDDRKTFEKRCEEDESFAAEVAFYLTTRQSLREELLAQKKSEWQNKKTEEELPFLPSLKKSFANRWVTYAAAACLVLAASVYLFETNTSPKKYASNYVAENYSNIGVTLDASHDSLQLGLDAYNNKDYNRALQLFTGVENNDPQNSDAKKYAGLAYLQKDDYDNAIQQFDNLAEMKIRFNSGDFLKAISLMERNKPGDKEEAKKLLQKVIDEKEDGSDKAADWLKRF